MRSHELFLGIPVLALVGCGAGRSGSIAPVQPLPTPSKSVQTISDVNLGHLWPFSVDHGTIACKDKNEALFVAPDGTRYALNRNAEQAGYPTPDPIRVKGVSNSSVSLGAVTSDALKLCGG